MTPKKAQLILKAMKYCNESERKDFILNYVNMNNKIENKVYNMDCIEGMKMYPDKYFDLAIVDPPYGIGEDGKKNHSRGNLAKAKQYTDKNWDSEPPSKEYFDELIRVSKNQIIFGANHFISRIPYDSSCWIVWDKVNGENDFADCELAWTSFSTAVRKFRFAWNGMIQGDMKNKEIRVHPTQKPIKLYDWLLQNYANSSDKILDTHLGSGSSRIAAHKAKLSFVGFEIDKDYYDASIKRYELAIQQQTLF
jgi:site-specific DNA-methyltransferase (adenine-specific)